MKKEAETQRLQDEIAIIQEEKKLISASREGLEDKVVSLTEALRKERQDKEAIVVRG